MDFGCRFFPRGWSGRSARALALLLGVLFASPTPSGLFPFAAAAEWAGREEIVEGVVHVKNPAASIEGAVDLPLEELFSLGGESEDDDELFGLVQEILLDEDGNSYLLDQQLDEIRVFDPKGRFVKSLGRQGEGPGEFQNPQTFFFLPDGNIGVAQMMPARIAVLDRQGEGLDDLPVPGSEGGFTMVRKVLPAGDHLVMQLMVAGFGEGKMRNTNRLVAVDSQGNELSVFGESFREFEVGQGQMVISMGDEEFARVWTAAPDGTVYVVNDYTGYRIEVYGADGKLAKVIEREFEPLPFTKEEDARRRKRWEEQPRRGGLEVKPDFPEFKPDITDLVARPDGELWVRTSRSSAGDRDLGTFDVFDREGRFVRVVRPMVEYDARHDGYLILGDRFYRIKELNGALKAWVAGFGGGIRIGNESDEDEEEEAAPLEILAYRIGAVAP